MFLLVGCSSNMRYGDNMMEAGDYNKAVYYYEQALKESPGDEDITSKLLEAQYAMVSADLIKVRQLRQGNQALEATHLLNKTLSHLTQWNVQGDSGVKTTIEEEVREAGKWLNTELLTQGKNGQHNTWGYYRKAFSNIYSTRFTESSRDQYENKMLSLGQQQCLKMKDNMSAQSYYYYTTWQAFCAQWSKSVNYPLATDNSRFKFARMRGKQLKINRAIQVSVPDFNRGLANRINQHPWFSSESQLPLTIYTSGQLRYAYTKNKRTFNHTIVSQEETYEILKDPKDKNKVTRKLLKKTPVRDDISFKGFEHKENYSHHVTAFMDIHKRESEVSHQQAIKHTTSFSHNQYIDNLNIRPTSAKLMDKDMWQKNIQKSLAQQLVPELDQAWIYFFCETEGKLAGINESESVARCAKLAPQHAKVEAWSKEQFGLTVNQLAVYLK